MLNIERIFNPKESLEEIKESLLIIYKEDYSKNYVDQIKQRINDTFYFFESTPDITLYFMIRNAPHLDNTEQMYTEWVDYLNKMFELKKELTKELFIIYAIAFNLNKAEQLRLITKAEEFIELPIKAFSNKAKLIENNDKKEEYIKRCYSLGIKPIFDSNIIDNLLLKRYKYETNCKTKLIAETIWGKRITEEFNKAMGTTIYPSTIADIIYGNPCNVRFGLGSSKNILYFPVIAQCEIGDVDSSFLHETRHMVECGRIGSGLDSVGGDYKILNELRVEKHAIEDNYRTEIIFSKSPIKKETYTPYRRLFSLADEFIDSYKSHLDQLAIGQNIKELERIFGKAEISDYGRFLNQSYENLVTASNLGKYVCSNNDIEKSKVFLKKIRSNAIKNNIN